MGGGNPANSPDLTTSSIDSMVEIKKSPRTDAPALEEEDRKYLLLYSKSKVYVHPTAYSRDNIPGWMALVRKEGLKPVYMIAWIPESLLEERGQEEWDKYNKVEISAPSDDEDGVLVDVPTQGGESYAFSVSLATIYSLLIYPPSFSSWYGSIVIHLASGETLPTLYFHDDESRSFKLTQGVARPQFAWGGEEFLQRLQNYANILRSSLQASLYLINPSRADIDTHTTVLFSDDAVDEILSPSTSTPRHKRRSSRSLNSPNRTSVLHQTLAPPSPGSQATMALLQGFSQITRGARSTAQRILSHPLAKPIVPHLPDPVKSLVSANGEWASWVEKGGVGEYEGARVYLARWARIVAEEGERARRRELQEQAMNGGEGEEDGGLGVFEVIRQTSNFATPRATRDPKNPIDKETWSSWFAGDGRPLVDKEYMLKEVFRRGCNFAVRRKAWPFILDVLPWDADEREREIIWAQKKQRYQELKGEWYGVDEVFNREDIIDERHRIDVDCRRTDRTHPLFMVPQSAPSTPNGGPSQPKPHKSRFSPSTEDIGAQAATTEHVERLCEILLTYNLYEKDLGYVQGMSDLCAPIYVVTGADEVMTFWCFVSVMDRMKQNFLRDQSGMKKQLAALQQLLAVMDPALYKHLEKTDSLNLFFCYRWVLISFKREFQFDDVLKLWEVLWTGHYSAQFVLFVALAVLESHRDVIMRYLVEFDEILKYCNELSMTIEVDSTLAQAEVLFLSFRQLVEDIDRRQAEQDSGEGLRQRKGGLTISKLPVIEASLRELLLDGDARKKSRRT